MFRQFIRKPISKVLQVCQGRKEKIFASWLRPLSENSHQLTEGEQRISDVLYKHFPQSTFVRVGDISGGCGAMYEVEIISEDFRGKRTVMQHKMVNEALKEEIKDMHGLRVSTAVPDT